MRLYFLDEPVLRSRIWYSVDSTRFQKISVLSLEFSLQRKLRDMRETRMSSVRWSERVSESSLVQKKKEKSSGSCRTSQRKGRPIVSWRQNTDKRDIHISIYQSKTRRSSIQSHSNTVHSLIHSSGSGTVISRTESPEAAKARD